MNPLLPRSVPPAGMHIPLKDILGSLRECLLARDGAKSFQDAVQRAFGVRHAFLYSSGKAALSVALQALGSLAPERDEVLIPAFTSYSVPSAVVNAGFKVSLYDLDAKTLAPDLASLERAVTGKTLCAVACHLFGIPCDMEAFRAVCRAHGVPVLDDAAQAMGASRKGGLAGTMGDIGLFSLGRGKAITCVSGGVLATDDDRLAQAISAVAVPEATRMDDLRACAVALAMNVLLRPRLYWIPQSLPFMGLGKSQFDPNFPVLGLGSFQAALGRRMLAGLDESNSRRRDQARAMLSRLGDMQDELAVPVPGDCSPVYPRLPLLAGDGHADRLGGHGVSRSYPDSLDRLEPLRGHLASASDCPGARRLAAELVTVPTHSYLTGEDMDAIASGLAGGQGRRPA
ncbi:DegT/DnrJ/EryC1/StrS family aminotransferase [Fundidesulfovibrio terrae]|uniref:DegT/DnrJ/EryC1/StrS family aminotransferase n=1 Tax=Fundidesulfovibrio terrae TaxID=2922866 RepID=UPI001FAFB587|nr:aminotransferase class I/II-fold pyridoxal phosphate-dependent enzyme [Fundidesulfovibrio terrae]